MKVDCCAWYPWRRTTTEVHEQRLGFDSCGIFYIIGGVVEVIQRWNLSDLPSLTAVADDIPGEKELDEYEGQNCPGQRWAAYRSTSHKESHTAKDLRTRLIDLLTPSTTAGELLGL